MPVAMMTDLIIERTGEAIWAMTSECYNGLKKAHKNRYHEQFLCANLATLKFAKKVIMISDGVLPNNSITN